MSAPLCNPMTSKGGTAPLCNPPLRVAVDARPLDIPYLRSQGIGRYAHGLLGPLAEVAAERGGQLVLLREPTSGPAAFAQPGGDPEPTSALPGAPTLRLRRPQLPPRLADWPEHLLLPIDLRRTRAQLLHALSIYRTAVRPGLPSVMTMHDVIPLMWPDEYMRTGLKYRVLYAAARRARLLLAVSEASRRDILDHLDVDPGRVLTVHEAADARFAPADPRGVRERLGLKGPYVLYVGGLSSPDPRKNAAGLIDAFERWRVAGGREETLVLAGELSGPGEELRASAQRAGARVLFAGFAPDEELPALYSGASCFVTASRYEGFGLPALEAISCATPVAAFDAGAVPEVAGPGALMAPPGDLASLMGAVGRICDEPELRRRLANQGREHARRFSWRRTAELTWAAYEQAARGGAKGDAAPL
ncbi:MAG: glycosyltransferase family 4 protein [Thermoleophilaceae bacterium]|nr:glycosyltransferase family 4 protein [Thermoleophilaceae bacterium]